MNSNTTASRAYSRYEQFRQSLGGGPGARYELFCPELYDYAWRNNFDRLFIEFTPEDLLSRPAGADSNSRILPSKVTVVPLGASFPDFSSRSRFNECHSLLIRDEYWECVGDIIHFYKTRERNFRTDASAPNMDNSLLAVLHDQLGHDMPLDPLDEPFTPRDFQLAENQTRTTLETSKVLADPDHSLRSWRAIPQPIGFECQKSRVGPSSLHQPKREDKPRFETSENPFSTRELRRDSSADLFVITGMPSIGKSGCLLFVLLLRLQAGLPTIWMEDLTQFYVFNSEGFFSVPLSLAETGQCSYGDLLRWLPRETWILCDDRPVSPVKRLPKVLQDTNFFVVYTSSSPPGTTNPTKVRSFLTVATWYMKPQSLTELMVMRQLCNREMRSVPLVQCLLRFPPCSRDVFNTMSPGTHAEKQWAVLESLLSLDYEKLVHMLEIPDLSGKHGSSPLLLYVPTCTRNVTITVPTRHLVRLLYKVYLKGNLGRLAEMFVLFSQDPSKSCTAPVLGWLVESAIHLIMQRGGLWPALKLSTEGTHWLPALEVDELMNSPSKRPSSDGFLDVFAGSFMQESARGVGSSRLPFSSYTRVQDLALSQSGYYVPTYRSQSTFDGFIFLKEANLAIVLRACSSSSLTVKAAGLRALRDQGVGKIWYVIITAPLQDTIDVEVESEAEDLVDLKFHITVTLQELTTMPPLEDRCAPVFSKAGRNSPKEVDLSGFFSSLCRAS
ncbi:hypothetical protein EIP91_010099 [Steccherinum ochraceum]|uniref:Uncharacterized protein n=1 Tax=Steccherinum ochraceum TaxID=92696 RepID=A0A4R0RUY2_9APHY|nr:hypothetical protein EIP91_010099 [Steccherinum ochraceum]